MLRIRRFILLLVLFAATAPAQPRRIVSTAPSVTEILFALGLGDRVVGATEYCNYPPEAKKVRRIGTWVTPNLEAIVDVRPELVVMQRTEIHDASRFASLKLKVVEVRTDTVANILLAIRTIADSAGVPSRGARLAGDIRAELDRVKARVASRPPTSYVFIVGRTPGTLQDLIAAGGKTYLSEVFQIAGGRNVLAGAIPPYPKIPHEEILGRDPDVIVDMGDSHGLETISEDHRRQVVELWKRYSMLKAVRDGRVHVVGSEVFVTPGPRVVELARRLVAILHPEAAR